ncbi:histidine phosphatase family protein, partial [Acidovorax sp.]|uniref:histidine phosphatase family protein n=1 Tax=Acidovorax sp. TaxID=1872122 RepID=UPI00391EE454
MPSSPQPEAVVGRRALLGAGLAWTTLHAWAAQDTEAEALLRKGGVVAAFRHALAPGTFDPPGFRLGDCSTQRNLSEEGREQARRTGAWFKERQLQPAKVLSSPWCRCIDSATLAFAAPQVWPA